MFHSSPRLLSVSFSLILLVQYSLAAERLGKNLTLHAGAINGVIISQNGQRLAVYGDPRKNPDKVDTVLVTHHRRDVVWAARALVDGGAKLIVPEKERMYFEEPEKQWADFIKIRLVDAQQQTTKMIRSAFQVSRGVKEGDKLQWQGINFEVLETPGFTRDAVTYLTTLDGDRVAFTGDLIYGDGKIFDLYSFQDKIPAAKIGGYHGYGSRLAELLKSLENQSAYRSGERAVSELPLHERALLVLQGRPDEGLCGTDSWQRRGVFADAVFASRRSSGVGDLNRDHAGDHR